MAMVRMREADVRAAMRDRRYWQAGHPARADDAAWVREGWQRLHGPDATVEGGERVVQVRAYDRVRNRRAERVEAHAQRRRGGGDAGARETLPRAAPGQSHAPAPAPQRPTLVIFVGGLFDGSSGIVQRSSEAMKSAAERRRLPVTVQYASHDQGARLRSWIQGAAPGTRIVVVGHSWGADTAAQVVARLRQEGRLIDQLVTIDPVGTFTSDDYFRRVRAGALEWINVNASNNDPMDPGNQVAQLGRPYRQRPAPFASQHIDAPFPHGDFRSMLDSIASGQPDGAFGRLLGR